MQMDYGDIVRLFALVNRTKKEVDKGIVMDLIGSKFLGKWFRKDGEESKSLYTHTED
jgi:hypothetical protein